MSQSCLQAWALHENNRSLDLIDPRLIEFNENEAIRVVGVAFLCTQASPMLRPTMSRVVAMLAGDIEVSTITSKPSYLTDWDFNDTTSGFLSEDTQTSFTSNESPSNPKSCASNKSASNPTPSPVNISGPMLHGIVGDWWWRNYYCFYNSVHVMEALFILLLNFFPLSVWIFSWIFWVLATLLNAYRLAYQNMCGSFKTFKQLEDLMLRRF